jgi:hypothetical protein
MNTQEKYKIHISWWSSIDVEVTAGSEEEALKIAEDGFDIVDALAETKSYEYVVDFEPNQF